MLQDFIARRVDHGRTLVANNWCVEAQNTGKRERRAIHAPRNQTADDAGALHALDRLAHARRDYEIASDERSVQVEGDELSQLPYLMRAVCACCGNPSSSAIDAIASASFIMRSMLFSTTVKLCVKSASASGEENREVPAVGTTALVPAR